MKLTNGEYFVDINSIKHWIKIEGAEHKTIPLIILHGGPGVIIIHLKGQLARISLKQEQLYITNNVAVAEAKNL